jgi:hypothetical protein
VATNKPRSTSSFVVGALVGIGAALIGGLVVWVVLRHSLSGNEASSAPSVSTSVGPNVIAVNSCSIASGGWTPSPSPAPASLPVTDFAQDPTAFNFYAGEDGRTVLGPAGWRCAELIAADGNTTLTVFPQGEQAPSFSVSPTPDSISAYFASTGTGSVYATVCPFFSQAIPFSPQRCLSTVPDGENLVALSSQVIEFSAGPGANVLFGGYPVPKTNDQTRGIVMYAPVKHYPETDELTCALPTSQATLCDAILNDFVTRNALDNPVPTHSPTPVPITHTLSVYVNGQYFGSLGCDLRGSQYVPSNWHTSDVYAVRTDSGRLLALSDRVVWHGGCGFLVEILNVPEVPFFKISNETNGTFWGPVSEGSVAGADWTLKVRA